MTQGIIELNAEYYFYVEGGTNLNFSQGNGKAQDGKNAPSFEVAFHHLEGQVSTGAIRQGDLKLRLDGPIDYGSMADKETKWSYANIKIGPTSYYEWKEDLNRTPEESQHLQQLGLEQHNDRGYYFSRGLGVDVLPLTSDKKVVVGIRRSTDYDGAIHGAAGWLTFTPEISSMKPMPIQEGYRELQEELALTQDNVTRMDLMGIVAYPHTLETDIIYLARIAKAKPVEYFTSGSWREAVDAKEHRELIVLSNPDEIHRLLQEGKPPADNRTFEVLPSTHYGLEVLANCWDKLGK